MKDLWDQQKVTVYYIIPYWHPIHSTGAVESEVVWVQWCGVLNGKLSDVAGPCVSVVSS